MKCPKCESHLITDDNSGIHECAKCHHKWLPNCAGNPDLDAALDAELRTAAAAVPAAGDAAPKSNLPSWSECQLRVHNSEFIAKQIAEGGYGADEDTLTANALHQFIYEYDCTDKFKSQWWRHRLELMLNEVAVQARVDAELTFAAFRRANVARCVKWHPEGIASWSPSDWLTAVTGELGELASLLKMRNRERDGLPGNKFSPTDKQVADEIADVLTYLDLLAAVLGVDLGSAAVSKFNEVSERVGFPDRIDLAAPAPRGGVTEEMREFVEVMLIDLSHGGGLLIKGNTDAHAKLTAVLKAYLATPPAAQAHDATAYMVESVGSRHLCFSLDDAQLFARDPSSTITPLVPAQAQDAGVKSNNAAIREHLRDDDRGSDAWWDRVHEKARALAAKEAK